jgi:hypothetical protein
VPFVQGEFRNGGHDDLIALLGFVWSAFVSKVRGWKDIGGEPDDNVAIFTRVDSPLKGLVSDRQVSSSESDVLPPAWGRAGQREGEW